jgi:hypothetical protein
MVDRDQARHAAALLYSPRTVWPGPFGAIITTSIVFFGSIRPKCTLRPCANAIAAPSRMFGAISFL